MLYWAIYFIGCTPHIASWLYPVLVEINHLRRIREKFEVRLKLATSMILLCIKALTLTNWFYDTFLYTKTISVSKHHRKKSRRKSFEVQWCFSTKALSSLKWYCSIAQPAVTKSAGFKSLREIEIGCRCMRANHTYFVYIVLYIYCMYCMQLYAGKSHLPHHPLPRGDLHRTKKPFERNYQRGEASFALSSKFLLQILQQFTCWGYCKSLSFIHVCKL